MDFCSGLTAQVTPVRSLPLPISKAIKSLKKGELMNPLIIIAVPLGLIILGMILNSWDLGFNQPPDSPEQDPVKRLTAEKESYRKFFDEQRSRSIKRQKRVGQYAWLVLASFIGAFIWLYVDSVNKTSLSTRIAGLQTLAT